MGNWAKSSKRSLNFLEQESDKENGHPLTLEKTTQKRTDIPQGEEKPVLKVLTASN